MGKEKKPINKLSVEKDFANIFKHIEEQNFETEEELRAYLDQMAGKPIDELIPAKKGKPSKKEKAQDLLIEAYESTPDKGRELAHKAMKLDPTNADIYVYLAETEEDPAQVLAYYSKGVEAGEKAIGEKEFEELKGHFWLVHETRPFMRAKAGLASTLWLKGQHDEAIRHYQEMLVWNPNDNQGIRYQLAVCLVEKNRRKDYLKLLNEFNDDISALWLYTHALYLFKQDGRSVKANRALRKAYRANPIVVEFFAGERPIPDYLPQYMGIGDESEALYCLNDSARIWIDTKGALDWINAFYQKQKG